MDICIRLKANDCSLVNAWSEARMCARRCMVCSLCCKISHIISPPRLWYGYHCNIVIECVTVKCLYSMKWYWWLEHVSLPLIFLSGTPIHHSIHFKHPHDCLLYSGLIEQALCSIVCPLILCCLMSYKQSTMFTQPDASSVACFYTTVHPCQMIRTYCAIPKCYNLAHHSSNTSSKSYTHNVLAPSNTQFFQPWPHAGLAEPRWM